MLARFVSCATPGELKNSRHVVGCLQEVFDPPKVIVSKTMDSIQEDEASVVSEGSHVTGN